MIWDILGYIHLWDMRVYWNRGTSKSSTFIGFSIRNHPALGVTHLWKPPDDSAKVSWLDPHLGGFITPLLATAFASLDDPHIHVDGAGRSKSPICGWAIFWAKNNWFIDVYCIVTPQEMQTICSNCPLFVGRIVCFYLSWGLLCWWLRCNLCIPLSIVGR